MNMTIILWGGPGCGKELEVSGLNEKKPDFLVFGILNPEFDPDDGDDDLMIIPPDMIDNYTYVRGQKVGEKWVYEIQHD